MKCKKCKHYKNDYSKSMYCYDCIHNLDLKDRYVDDDDNGVCLNMEKKSEVNMGMYNYVDYVINCPCGSDVTQWQTKEGDPALYRVEAKDVNSMTGKCAFCGRVFIVKLPERHITGY
jgi:hypothetical protein